MTTVTESDLKELKDLILRLESKIEKLVEGQQELKVDLATVKGEIKRLDDINGRLNIMTVGFLSIIGVLVTGVLGAIGRLVFFPNP